MIRYIKLMCYLVTANIRSRLSYSFNFFIGITSVVFLSTANIVLSWIITLEVPNINGYGFYDLVFIFSLWMLPHSVFIMFFSQLWDIDSVLRTGGFDRFLIRPLSPLFQFCFSRFEVAGVGDLIAGLIGISISINYVTNWEFKQIAVLIPFLISGLLIEWSIYLLIACTSFWTLQSKSINIIVTNFIQQFARFPLSIYSIWVQIILTFIIPIAFINFYPSFIFIDNAVSPPFSIILPLLSPLVAIVLLCVSLYLWKKAINNYKGAGT